MRLERPLLENRGTARSAPKPGVTAPGPAVRKPAALGLGVGVFEHTRHVSLVQV